MSESESAPVNITGGPLQYTYRSVSPVKFFKQQFTNRFTEIILHWGKDGQPGSEHSINHHSFPAEIQVFGYNSDLYPDIEAARKGVRGLVAISLMVQVKDLLSNHLMTPPIHLYFRLKMMLTGGRLVTTTTWAWGLSSLS